MKHKILAILFVLLGVVPCLGQEAPGQFIRYVEGENPSSGELQIAKATYVHPETKVEVVMYGVVHLGEKDYYEEVQEDLDSYTAVLFEGVGTPEEKKKFEKSNLPPNPITLVQQFMCEILGMRYQLNAINYKTPRNFVHADISAREFAIKSGRTPIDPDRSNPLPTEAFTAESFLGSPMGKMVVKFGMSFARNLFDSNPSWRNMVKLQMAKQLSSTTASGGKIPGMSEAQYNLIVIERNKIVMKVLKRESDKRKKGTLCVFYGAAHMPDFHERMTKLGYKQKNKSWMTAWKIGRGAGLKPVGERKTWF